MNNKYTFIGINTEEEINIYDKNDKLYFTCTDSYDGATIELSKDKAIELANKILEMCGETLSVNMSDLTSWENDFNFNNKYPKVNNVDNKRFFDGYQPKEYFKTDDNDLICDKCNCNPKNGGSGICNCTLATYKSY